MTITTGSEVKAVAQLTNEYTDTEILTEIDIVEAELYNRYNLPKRSSFSIDDDYTDFYVSNDDVYDITRVQVSVDTAVDPSGYLTVATGSTTWTHTAPNNYITLAAAFITSYDTKSVRVQYIPKAHNLIATNTCALNLIDATTITDGENTIEAPLVTRIKDRITRYKMLVKPRTIVRSSAYSQYDNFDYESITQSNLR